MRSIDRVLPMKHYSGFPESIIPMFQCSNFERPVRNALLARRKGAERIERDEHGNKQGTILDD
jgi:hypothetical protein